VSPKPKAQLAREHLERAVDGIDADDATEAVTWLLAALEAAIVAIAENQGMDAPTHHWKKAQVARELHESGVVEVDYSDALDLLNAGRKVAIYEGEDPDLGESSLEDLVADVRSAVQTAEQAGAS
jgi:hypothetical protein